MEAKRQIERFCLCLCALLPLMLFRDASVSNELRYLSIIDEALRDGHFFAFYNHGIAYADKPPLFFWLMMLGKQIFGCHSMLYLSLLALIPSFVTVVVLDRWCAKALSKEYRLAAEAALLSTFYYLASAVVVRMDMMMTMFITLALYTFYRRYNGDDSLKLKIAFPIYIFLSIFSKGAVGILVPLVCVPVFLLVKRQIRTIARYWGWFTCGILIILCGLWFFAAYVEGGSAYLNNLLFHQTVDRAVNAFYHKAPIYYYALRYWYIMFPWCFLTAGVIIYSIFRKDMMNDLACFMASTSLTIILMMSCVSSKLDIYILPALGFTIYATFLLLPSFGHRRFVRVTLLIPLIIFALLLPALIILKLFASDIPYLDRVDIWIPVPLSLAAIYGIKSLYKDKLHHVAMSIATGLFATIFLFGLQVKDFNELLGYKDFCTTVREEAVANDINRYVLEVDDQGKAILNRGENVDVFLGPIDHVATTTIENSLDSLIGDTKGIIVLTQQDKKPNFAVYKHK